MAFWSNIFGQSEGSQPHENRYTLLRNRLAFHEHNAAENLHHTHPHLNELFTKYGVNPRELRRKSVRVATAAAVLGAFLAIPHLTGHPTFQPAPGSLTGSKERERHATTGSTSGPPLPGQPNAGSQPPSDGINPPTDQSKSQGHLSGRSFLAPPKEHGLHDLGLHKGELKNPQVPEIGPHPSELPERPTGGNVHKEGKTT